MFNSSNRWKEYSSPPRQTGVGFSRPLHYVGRWDIYRRFRVNESREFEVDFICRTPNTPGLYPDSAEIMEIFGSSCDHVERVPEFVGGSTRWRYWVVSLSAQKSTVQALLLCPRAQCGCDPWLDSSSSRKVYESLRKWLKLRDKV